MKLLFIGNSHTYYNALPETVLRLLEATGQRAHVTVLTEGGKGLGHHVLAPHVSMNIRCGGYDTVIVQDRATSFDPVLFRDGARKLKEMADKAGSRFLLYMPWAGRDRRDAQLPMTEAYHAFSRETGCPLAPAGELFGRLLRTEEPSALYREDGNHATPLGSYAAAVAVFYALTDRKRVINVSTIRDPGVAAGISPELCQRIHTEACHVVRLYNG